MPNDDVRAWVTFDAFTRLVGRPAYKLRRAVVALDLLPRRFPRDRRVFVYNPEWAAPVRQWIDTARQGEIAGGNRPLTAATEATEAQGELLTFGEFRARVGVSETRVRTALRVLDYQPILLRTDLRHTRYRASWVHPAREWLSKTGRHNR